MDDWLLRQESPWTGRAFTTSSIRFALHKEACPTVGFRPITIRLLFLQTHHDPEFQVYTLDVAMQIDGTNVSFANVYHIVSHDSLAEKLFTSAAEAKRKSAQKLINANIPDNEKSVVANSVRI